jgi:hypothetical protein
MRSLPPLLAVLAAALVVAGPAGAASKPRIGRTAVVKPLSGVVLLKKGGSFARLRRVRTVSIGAILDSQSGKVRVTTAANGKGKTQSGVFHGGRWQIQQKKGSALTTLALVGDDGCSSAKSAGGVHAARRSRRSLFGRAHGRFRTRGRHSSATVRGTVWATEDLCSGATLTRAYSGGHVEAKSDTSEQDLKPGQSSEDFCSDNGYPGLSDLYCISLFSDPASDVFGFAIATFDPGYFSGTPAADPPRDVDVCITSPKGVQEPCRNYKLEGESGGLWLQSDGCSPASGTGAYTVQWRLRGTLLPVPLTYTSKHAGAGIGCVNSQDDPAPKVHAPPTRP